MSNLIIFDVVIAALGIYLIYSGLHMKKTGEVNAFLVSREELGKCRDKKGFVEKIYRQTMFFGAVSFLYGVLGCVNSLLHLLGRPFDVCAGMVFLAACAWFAWEMRRKKEGFFP